MTPKITNSIISSSDKYQVTSNLISEVSSKRYYDHNDMKDEVVNSFYSRGIHKIAAVWIENRYDSSKSLVSKNNPFPYKRGKYQCGSCKTMCRRSTKCGFSFCFRYDIYEKCIRIYNLSLPYSSHHFFPTNKHSSNLNFITNEDEVPTHIKEYIELVGPDRSPIATVRLGIARLDGKKVTLERNLLHRLMKKARVKHLGKDGDSMEEFYKYGNQIKSAGGVFEVRFCNTSTRLIQVHLQHQIATKLVKQYGRHLFYMDTTANTTRYSFKNYPAIGMDCFGSLCPLGNSLIEVEDHSCIENCLLVLGLNNAGACCGTDRAPGWKIPLEKCSIKHFYDTWHFSRNAFQAAGGSSQIALDFRSSVNKALYTNFNDTKETLNEYLFKFLGTLKSGSPKHNLVKELIFDQTKLCYTHTGKMFICSRGSASRGESAMNQLKSNSSMKKNV